MTRRDFLNATLLGAGALLLDLPAPSRLFAQSERPWGGYSGVGDYSVSNGNTEDVVRYAHAMRDGKYETAKTSPVDTGESYDLVIIGGGMSGLGAAAYFRKTARAGQSCLIIENHPMVGGESKRNEFSVNGQRLIGPQGANSFVVLDDPAEGGFDIYSELGLPRSFTYQRPSPAAQKLHFDRTNFGFMIWYDSSPSFGYFFEGQTEPWAADIWNLELGNTPFTSNEKKAFMVWRNSSRRYYEGENFREWLDTMTYKDYLEKVMGLSPAVTRFVGPVLAASIGLGADAISAYGAFQVSWPGFRGSRAVFQGLRE